MQGRPKMSVNKLGEYMVASPSRRERIIADQKDPQPVRTNVYNEAQRIATRFIVSGDKDGDYLDREIQRLSSEAPASTWQAQSNMLCADAITAFKEIVDAFNSDGLTLRYGDLSAPKLHIEDVGVSVRPEVVVTRTNRFGDQCVGAMKLHFPKTHHLGKKGGEYVASTVHQFVTEHPPALGKPDYGLCSVVDVSAGEMFSAPLAYKRRRADIEAACREIAWAWDAA